MFLGKNYDFVVIHKVFIQYSIKCLFENLQLMNNFLPTFLITLKAPFLKLYAINMVILLLTSFHFGPVR